ncbi:unnamed protein product [Vitrella brassicaformis CCMP3155]|uniref:Ubiquitin-like domain-containing protein n=1 Tax=Vitrella brassicaformis (strain CCMP3155) TaxID=1169540 RepID=A0A0G4FLT8_VITBC|nr:unnamed protein product [Vitrella brassicaformis CCMP3155]|eukprot:CEM14887.1 unnamed protein product [Vitrella brassicaformis CCMP3155]
MVPDPPFWLPSSLADMWRDLKSLELNREFIAFLEDSGYPPMAKHVRDWLLFMIIKSREGDGDVKTMLPDHLLVVWNAGKIHTGYYYEALPRALGISRFIPHSRWAEERLPDEEKMARREAALTAFKSTYGRDYVPYILRDRVPFTWINVKTLSGERVLVHALPEATVAEVKFAVFEVNRVPVHKMRLVHAGRQLQDHRLLSDYAARVGQLHA